MRGCRSIDHLIALCDASEEADLATTKACRLQYAVTRMPCPPECEAKFQIKASDVHNLFEFEQVVKKKTVANLRRISWHTFKMRPLGRKNELVSDLVWAYRNQYLLPTLLQDSVESICEHYKLIGPLPDGKSQCAKRCKLTQGPGQFVLDGMANCCY